METNWRVPSELPDLRRVGLIALDTETKDNGLAADRGSGWAAHQGYLCGVSVAYRAEGDIVALYIPIRHPDTENFDPKQVYTWLEDHVGSDLRFALQNSVYDFGWLRAEAGIRMPPGRRLEEIGALATMVDENRYQYGLDALCEWRGLPGKDESLLREGCAALGLITNKRKKFRPQNYIWQLPASYVGSYAEVDAVNTLRLYEDLDPILDRENTRSAYRLECDLLPMVLEMRRGGVRIDVAAAERARDLLLAKRDAVLKEISDKLGTPVSMFELARNKWLAETFDREGIKYPRTDKGNPSFTGGQKGWMDRHPHWLPKLIREADKYHMAGANFVEKYILDYVVNDRIHAEIHPHRSEANGTKSFRFSYSDPPLQLMSSRDEELTPLIRGLFLPEENQVWAKPDASQQEFRFAVHYAAVHNVPKANIALQRYLDDPDTDFHAFAGQITGLDRKNAKNVNFAKIYGAGVRKFAAMIGKPEHEAKAIYDQYDRELPFLRMLSRIYQSIARRQGYILLYDGARRHFDKWALGGTWEKGAGPCERVEAERRLADPDHPWFRRGQLCRADTHNALNALIQGSAARHTKLWMRAVWREGIVPLLQMHDALECSVATREQAEMVAQLCVEAIKLKVPMRVDLKFGRTWGDAKHTWEELHGRVAVTPELVLAQSQFDEVPPPSTEPPPVTELPPTTEPPPRTETPTTEAPPITKPLATQPATAATSEPPWTAYVRGAQQVHLPDSEVLFVSLRDVIGGPLIGNKVICPFHDDHKPSCHIYHDHYFCFVCGASGDAISWLMEVEGLTYTEAVNALETFEPRAHPPEHEQGALRLALALWEQAKPIAGTLAEHYLTGRHIDVAQMPADVPLRFHSHCLFGAGKRHPCLLALLRDIETNAPAGILRTALTADGCKLDRLSLGRWHAPRAIKLWPAGETLVVGEGIETVLAAATRLTHEGAPLRPAWATVGTGRLATLPPILGVKRLIILTDNDDPGRAAARACAQCATNAGCTALLLTPISQDNDFNDVVRGRAA
jgi:DNA polymerase I-like protein with 3'-5' exonuclease and polymerase domains